MISGLASGPRPGSRSLVHQKKNICKLPASESGGLRSRSLMENKKNILEQAARAGPPRTGGFCCKPTASHQSKARGQRRGWAQPPLGPGPAPALLRAQAEREKNITPGLPNEKKHFESEREKNICLFSDRFGPPESRSLTGRQTGDQICVP